MRTGFPLFPFGLWYSIPSHPSTFFRPRLGLRALAERSYARSGERALFDLPEDGECRSHRGLARTLLSVRWQQEPEDSS